MRLKDLVMGGMFFSIGVLVVTGLFLSVGDSYGVAVPSEFNNSFNRFAQLENLTSSASQSIQEDTFNPATLAVAITQGVLAAGKLLFSVPAILYLVVYEGQLLLGWPSWVAHFVSSILFLTVIGIVITLIAKARAED